MSLKDPFDDEQPELPEVDPADLVPEPGSDVEVRPDGVDPTTIEALHEVAVLEDRRFVEMFLDPLPNGRESVDQLTGGQKILIAQKARNFGYSWRVIAHHLHYSSAKAAEQASRRAMEAAGVAIDDASKQEALGVMLDRMDLLVNKFLIKALNSGSEAAAAIVLRIEQQRARLFKLEHEAPTNVINRNVIMPRDSESMVAALKLVSEGVEPHDAVMMVGGVGPEDEDAVHTEHTDEGADL